MIYYLLFLGHYINKRNNVLKCLNSVANLLNLFYFMKIFRIVLVLHNYQETRDMAAKCAKCAQLKKKV